MFDEIDILTILAYFFLHFAKSSKVDLDSNMSKEAWSHELQDFVKVSLKNTILEWELKFWKSGQYSAME